LSFWIKNDELRVSELTRHFLRLDDLSRNEVTSIIERAIELKACRNNGQRSSILENKTLAMIFEKSSTRTRVSFEAAMAETGGKAIFLSSAESQLARGELPGDTARVLSEMTDAIMVRTFEHEILNTYAEYASVPIINGLTNDFHPCQVLADLLTWFELRGDIEGKKVAWIGDGNNMCNSYINASILMGFELVIASPAGYETELTGKQVRKTSSARDAVEDADLVVTDVWASMGQENEAEYRQSVFKPYQVDEKLMSFARADALFMHCLPAHRGEEVTKEVLEGNSSVVWAEAGNRLHAQKALLEFLINYN
jgi:ornithine carbamoyltransferase